MKKLQALKCIFACVFAVLVFFSPPSASAGMKGKIQQKLNSQSNIQYEPYYLDTDYVVQKESEGGQEETGTRHSRRNINRREQSVANVPIEGLKEVAKREADIAPVLSRYAIYQTDYKAELEENVVTVTGKVIFQVFQKGWTQIPLVKTDVGLLDVSVNRGVAFVTMKGGKYYLMMDKPGKYTLHIEFLIKAARERENGPGSFRFDVMSAPISQFEFTMMEKGVEIFVEPAIKVEVKKEVDKTVAWAIMPNTTNIMTRWTKELPKEEITPAQLEPKVYADVATYASIGEGIIRCQSQLNYSILQAEVSNLRVAFPKDVSLLQVTGKDLRDWKITPDKGVQYLDVYLNFGVKGSYNLNLTYERNIGEGSVVAQIPELKALGVERENGYLGIAAKTNVELAVNKSERMTAIDVKDLPRSIWSSSANPLLLAFKYLNHPYSVEIEVTRHEELPVLVAAIDSAHYVTLHTEEGKVLTKATFQVRNNVKQFLRFVLPKDAELWSSFIAGKPVKPAKDKKGNILIPLEKSQLQGESLKRFPVEIVYLDKSKQLKRMGSIKLNLPKTDIPVSALYWSIYLPQEYRYFKFAGDVKRQKSARGRGWMPQRALQTRIRNAGQFLSSAQDSIGDQYSPGNTNIAQSLGLNEIDVSRKGILPIKIDVPQQGKQVRFSKLLVTEKESPWMSARYIKVPKYLRGIVRILIALGLFFLAGVLLKKLRKHGKKRRKAKEGKQSDF